MQTALEVLLAERISAETARIVEERVRTAFKVSKFGPDEVLGPMDSREAAEFFLPYNFFREITPNLLRHHVTDHLSPAGAASVAGRTVNEVVREVRI